MKMFKLQFFVLCFFITHVNASPQPTKLDTNREVIRTYVQVYLEDKEFESAERTLVDYLHQDGLDPGMWNLLGLTLLLQKKFNRAIEAFIKAIQLFPSKSTEQSLAQYNLADVYFQAAKTNEAKIILRTIIAKKDDLKVSAENTLDQILARELMLGQPLPPAVPGQRGRFRLTATLGTGYDSNVLLVDDLTSQSGGLLNAGSAVITPGVQLGYVGALWGHRLDSRMITSFTNYTSDSAKSFNLLYERADVMLGDSHTRVGITQEVSFINREPFQMYALNSGPVIQHRMPLSDGIEWRFELPVRYRFFYFDRNGNDENNRSGVDINASATFTRQYPKSLILNSQMILGPDLTKGQNFRMMKLIWPTSFSLPLPVFRDWGVMNTFGWMVSAQYYYQSNVERRDWLIMPTVGVSKVFSKSSRASLDYGLQKNFSTLQTARYSKHLITLSLSHDIL
jgi:hypothetical protein